MIGPIGNEIELKEIEKGAIVEKIIGRVLSNFVVSNEDDRNQLRKILKSVGGGADIFHSVILQPPHSRYAVNQPVQVCICLTIFVSFQEAVLISFYLGHMSCL